MRWTESFFASLWGLALLVPAGAAEERPDPRGVEFFEAKIRPVLVEHCYECHASSAKSLKGSLLLDTREGIRRGGESGPAVVPGEIEEGTLIGALRHETFEMPPTGKLPDRVIADFEAWIGMGAPDPRTSEAGPERTGIDLEQGRQFWSFQPLETGALPAPSDAAWAWTDIDRLVLARLEEAGLRPVRDADRRTLLRRVWFDLIGLPPSPEEVTRFLADDSPQALARVVDRLLESSQFGQRWGRHWLDVVRYAESTGGGRTRILYDAWRYRDYVVDSWNRDKPFDQFIMEQIAGDLMASDRWQQEAEQLTATGFLALGPTNYELQDKELLRMEVVDEQLDTIGRALLGMSIGCARCHDHKFDPIAAEDYYALAGIFRSTKTLIHANVSNFVERPLPVGSERQAKLDEHQDQVREIERQIARLDKQLESLSAELGNAPLDLENLPGMVIDNRDAQVVGQWQPSQSVKGFVGDAYLVAAKGAAGDQRVIYTPQIAKEGEYEVRVSYTAHANRASDAPITVRHASGESRIEIDQRRTPPLGGVFLSLGRFRFAAGDRGAVTIAQRNNRGHVIADAVQFLAVETIKADATGSSLDEQTRQALAAQVAETQTRRRQLAAQLKELQQRAPSPPPTVMSVEEEEQIADCPLHIRGSVRNLGDPVPRGVLRVATIGAAPEIPSDASGRLELARWIASPSNPLTARVAVNRIWHHLFGAGLVRTPDNFGSTGELPSHPRLLDHLAARFIEDGWSVKKMIRRIVLSRVYQLSSEDQDGIAADPENRLLRRANRRRLDAEAIRDAILTVSGELDPTEGGSLIEPSLESEFGYEFTGLRRSVYVPVFRNTMHDLFEVFDIADPNLVTGRRNTSTLPTQALYLMNSPFVMDQARLAARRLLAVEHLDLPQRVRLAHEQALGRLPSEAELELAARYMGIMSDPEPSAERELDRWAGFYQTLFACIDFRYLK